MTGVAEARSTMYTQCPQCSTLFRIGAAQLAQARGLVRCGICSHSFNALETLSERPEPVARSAAAPAAVAPAAPPPLQSSTSPSPAPLSASFEPWPDADSSAAPPAAAAAPTVEAAAPLAEPAVAAEMHYEPLPAPPLAATDTTDMPPFKIAPPDGRDAPPWISVGHGSVTRREPTLDPPQDEPALAPISTEPRSAAQASAVVMPRRRRSGLATALWGFANLALIVALLGQYAYFNREELAHYPELRPWLGSLCHLAGCELPMQKEPGRISLVNRVVQSHPHHDHALLIDATLVNDAGFTQPYPLLELRFSDLNNQLVAGRRFRPEEYLPRGTPLERGMAPQEPVKFSLEIADPGKEAVSFQFNLL